MPTVIIWIVYHGSRGGSKPKVTLRVCDIKVKTLSLGRSAGVPPAVAGASRSRAKLRPNGLRKAGCKQNIIVRVARAGCPRHSGRDARATYHGRVLTLM